MNVHPRNSILHGAKNVAIIKLRKIARKPTLYADLSGAELPRLDCLSGHVIQTVEVSIGLARPSAERAELASHETDVREVHVAVDHVGHDIAREFRSKHDRRGQHAQGIRTFDISHGA